MPSFVQHRLELEEKLKETRAAHGLVDVQYRVVAPRTAQADTWRIMLRKDAAHALSRWPVLASLMGRFARVDERLPSPSDLPVRLVPQTESKLAPVQAL